VHWLLLGLFLIGVALSVIGHMADRATHYPWLLSRIDPQYVSGTNALDVLAQESRRALTPQHPGFSVLLEKWPELSDRSLVALISRSVAFMELGPVVKNDFELIAIDENHNEVGPRWSELSARETLAQQNDRKLHRIGTGTFFVGIAISLFSGLARFITNV
jgi:hypothetical protein